MSLPIYRRIQLIEQTQLRLLEQWGRLEREIQDIRREIELDIPKEQE